MKRLVFYYSSMNSGKSLSLLTRNYALKQKGFRTVLAKPSFDTRSNETIQTRFGNIEEKCITLDSSDVLSSRILKSMNRSPDYVFVDECQFLTKEQVWDLAGLVDNWDIGVFAYGLKLNHMGEFFSGSEELMKLADELIPIENICRINKGAPAYFHIKMSGNFSEGSEVGGDDMYESVSRKARREWKDSIV